MTEFNRLLYLDWDSAFFNKKVAMLNLCQVVENATAINTLIESSSFDLIYVFALPEEGSINLIESSIHKAKWVDGKRTYLMKVPPGNTVVASDSVQSVSQMNNSLYELAIQAGVFSRFNTDQHFESNQYQSLYQKWIENSVNRSIATEVLVYKEHEEILGLITIGEKNNRADIGLVGVDTKARGKGIASKLLAHALAYAAKEQYDEIQVVTQQQNNPACKLYENFGFQLASVVNIFHIWK